MSLSWDTTHCPQGPCDGDTPEDDRAWLQVLVFAMMATDESKVDSDETLFRVRYLEAIGYPLANLPVPGPMIRRWHGTTVNVVPRTRQQFVTRQTARLRRDVERAVAQEISAVAP
jgi:hypothetical protein